MDRVLSMEQLAPLMTAQLCRGVRTNQTLAPEEHRREIGEGTLYVQPLPAGLLLLRRRPAHWILNFYLPPEAPPFSLTLTEPVVVEVPVRPKDGAAAAELLALLEASGFAHKLERIRLERPQAPHSREDSPFSLGVAGWEDKADVLALLEGCFDPLTGCLPGDGALALDLEAGAVICAREKNGALAGILHGARGKTTGEIRHLAVRPDLRGQGCAQSLIARWLESVGDCKTRVWTGRQHAAALRTYEKAGYRPDGWYSAVMCHMPNPVGEKGE